MNDPMTLRLRVATAVTGVLSVAPLGVALGSLCFDTLTRPNRPAYTADLVLTCALFAAGPLAVLVTSTLVALGVRYSAVFHLVALAFAGGLGFLTAAFLAFGRARGTGWFALALPIGIVSVLLAIAVVLRSRPKPVRGS
ncbi:MAG: hypothetical protein U0414_07045 [Polyangiaceae bacterium]